ncbi:hypothetical protein [Enterococcus cecorum]|uniref:hypothetical protein n=1 Tax=Enterococcus cecorum TaxID=44008 RepID=UPI00200B5FD6|nr:hypothetical protein [Enterococcus cecorum]
MNSKKKELLESIRAVYNQTTFSIDKNTKQAMVKAAEQLINDEASLSFISYQLFPFINSISVDYPDFSELQNLKRILLRHRWKYSLGMILSIPFIRH